jgi:hypothetical protein
MMLVSLFCLSILIEERVEKWIDRLTEQGTAMVFGLISLLILIGGGMFLYQSRQLSILQSHWDHMEPKVNELEFLRINIRRMNIWHDDPLRKVIITHIGSESCSHEPFAWNAPTEFQEPVKSMNGFQEWLPLLKIVKLSKIKEKLVVHLLRDMNTSQFASVNSEVKEDENG